MQFEKGVKMKKDFRIKNMSCNGKPIPDKYIACFNGYIEDVVNKAFAREQQLVIEELEKVKKYNNTLSLGGSPYVDVFIDNQIKSLKGDKNE